MAVRILLALAVLTLLYGCGQQSSPVEKREKQGGLEQAAREESKAREDEGSSAVLKLYPTFPPDPSGGATFTETDGGVRVKLSFQGLPKPHKSYLSHIHSGWCGTGGGHANHGQAGKEAADHRRGAGRKQGGTTGEHGKEHGGAHKEHGRESGTPQNIEYPLTPVESDAGGRGSSTTMLKDLTIRELYTGEAKYVNLHTGGTGNPPDLACANIIELD